MSASLLLVVMPGFLVAMPFVTSGFLLIAPTKAGSAKEWQAHVKAPEHLLENAKRKRRRANHRSKRCAWNLGSLSSDSLGYAKHCFIKLRSSFPRELTKEWVGLTPPCDFHGAYIHTCIRGLGTTSPKEVRVFSSKQTRCEFPGAILHCN